MRCFHSLFSTNQVVRFLMIPLFCLLSSSGIGFTADGSGSEILYLKNGQNLSGESVGFEEGNILFRLPDGEVRPIVMGLVDRLEFHSGKLDADSSSQEAELLVKNEGVVTPAVPPLITVDPLDAVPPAPDSESDRATPINQIEEYVDEYWEYVEIWTKRMELGGTFLGGNTDRDYLTTKLQLEKSDNDNLFEFEIGGRWGQSNGVRDANRWYGNATLDIAKTTDWIIFVTNKNTYDEFENLDWRGTLSSGLGYRFINEKEKRLILRVGPGGTREIYNSPRLRRTTLDVFVEIELHWPLSDHAKLEHKQTWTPSVDNVQVLRVTTESGLLFKLDNKDRWNLKFGLLQTYNSVPNAGRKKSDYTGSVSLVYTRK
ncbi:MAG: DUF481 domain-containing protein [Planctomycetes bacterium]|nr:DUF481 domain-containing protein [Planctomycetota bacterium]MCH9724670.1 DUF481 domain-containing protein [Planctomycetota bacterium]MCH9774821.1 DUF481 domain-containing protein [Planctomycetota bacterium]MCH9789317.1 DUF481 domain-containing protein [Planctomycetota bacterium]